MTVESTVQAFDVDFRVALTDANHAYVSAKDGCVINRVDYRSCNVHVFYHPDGVWRAYRPGEPEYRTELYLSRADWKDSSLAADKKAAKVLCEAVQAHITHDMRVQAEQQHRNDLVARAESTVQEAEEALEQAKQALEQAKQNAAEIKL